MKVRKRVLPEGWYPRSANEIEKQFLEWDNAYSVEENKVAAVVPHAGWFFSGKLAYAGIKALSKECDLLFVIGGHLSDSSSVLGYFDEEIETPLGNVAIEKEVLKKGSKHFQIREDTKADNTIEIQMPIVKYFFPNAKISAFRLPPNKAAADFTRTMHEVAEAAGYSVGLIGSTDLTHYGPSYDFTPKGVGKDAIKWVEEENDKAIINAMVHQDTEEVIRLGTIHHAACSAGAAAAAVEYGKIRGIRKGKVIDYYTSAAIHPGASFVGYAGVVF